jgi:hypothetical protein
VSSVNIMTNKYTNVKLRTIQTIPTVEQCAEELSWSNEFTHQENGAAHYKTRELTTLPITKTARVNNAKIAA